MFGGMPPGNPLQKIGIPGVRPPQGPHQGMEPATLPAAQGMGQTLAGAGGIQPPQVNVGVKFPVPPPMFPSMLPPDPAMSGMDMNNMANFRNIGPALAHAQSPQTTYGFSSGNPGQLASNSNRLQGNSEISALEHALRQQMGGV